MRYFEFPARGCKICMLRIECFDLKIIFRLLCLKPKKVGMPEISLKINSLDKKVSYKLQIFTEKPKARQLFNLCKVGQHGREDEC